MSTPSGAPRMPRIGNATNRGEGVRMDTPWLVSLAAREDRPQVAHVTYAPHRHGDTCMVLPKPGRRVLKELRMRFRNVQVHTFGRNSMVLEGSGGYKYTTFDQNC